MLTIPCARHTEQAQLEADVLLSVCHMGGLSAHPLGIIRLRPEPDRLTIQLLNAPYVIWYWAEYLLPRLNSGKGDPRDCITGVPGLRYHREGRTVCLYRPSTPAQIILTGFVPRWWDRVVRRMHAEYQDLLQQPGWTSLERAAHEAEVASRFQPGGLFSPLLRRIRATAGPGPLNAASTWHAGPHFCLESTDGPPCPDIIRLFGDGPTGVGWRVDRKRCTCLCDHDHDSCNINFIDPSTEAFVYYTNGRWNRAPAEAQRQRIADLNATALA
ncbi:hypothetical protein [Streptomyces puniciscabiei]|uniref:hypothetical protein n=1 Tax=Streptomyces puniciscabiei TaxID=164348 RepID=UPI0033277E6C